MMGRAIRATHVQGGTIMGATPENSAVNSHRQPLRTRRTCWSLGAHRSRRISLAHPTMTILAQTYRTADVIVDPVAQTARSARLSKEAARLRTFFLAFCFFTTKSLSPRSC